MSDIDSRSLSFGQEVALAVLPIPSAMLSFLGSSTILFAIFHQRAGSTDKLIGTRRRILVGMSAFDIFYSISLGLHYFMLPKGTFMFAVGNDQTCRAIGTFYQFGVGAAFYYVALSFYYLLTVRYAFSGEWVARHVEPFMHGIAIIWPMVTGLVGAGLDVYNPSELIPLCWVDDFPRGCNETGETCYSTLIGWIFGGFSFMLMVASLAVNNTLIYLHVRQSYKQAFQSTAPPRRSMSKRFSSRFFPSSLNFDLKDEEEEVPVPGVTSRGMSSKSFSSRFFASSQNAGTKNEGVGSNGNAGERNQNKRMSTTGTIDGGAKQRQRIHKVATQAALFITVGVITYMPVVVLKFLESADIGTQSGVFPLTVFFSTLNPLSGFFNALIFFRPRYKALRADKHYEVTRWEALQMTVLGYTTIKNSRFGRRRQVTRSTDFFQSGNSGLSGPGSSNMLVLGKQSDDEMKRASSDDLGLDIEDLNEDLGLDIERPNEELGMDIEEPKEEWCCSGSKSGEKVENLEEEFVPVMLDDGMDSNEADLEMKEQNDDGCYSPGASHDVEFSQEEETDTTGNSDEYGSEAMEAAKTGCQVESIENVSESSCDEDRDGAGSTGKADDERPIFRDD